MKQKIRTILILLLFFITVIALGVHIFDLEPGVTVSAPAIKQLDNYNKVAELPLGKVEAHNYQRMGFTKGFVRFSPDNRYLAIGTDNGDILVLTAKGKVVWQKSIGLGKIAALEFTGDSRYLLLGETSQQGYLLCFDTVSGREVWRQASAGELGVDIKDKTYPGIVAIKTDAQGHIYAVGQRYIRYADGRNEYRGRIYKLDEQGNRLAVFPEDHNLDAWVSWVSVDERGTKAVFGTANWDTAKTSLYTGTIYCLDGNLEKLWSVFLEPLPPYQNTTMRSSPEIDGSGRFVAGIASDGRVFLYDGETGAEKWQRTISQPQKIAGVYMNATGSNVQIVDRHFIFTTGNTYNRANWQLPTPVEHPNSNSAFLFDEEGKLVSLYRFGGMIEQLAVNKQEAVAAIGRNVRTKDPGVHGLYILSLPDFYPVDYIPTIGPCVSAAISSDGRYIAGVEAPLQLDDGQIIGNYKIILLERK